MISDRSDEQLVEDVRADLSLGDTSNIIDDLTLPTVGTHGTEISWHSSNTDVITDEGIVHRPEAGLENVTAILTATIVKGDATASKSFAISVLAEREEGLIAYYAFEGNLSDSTGNFDPGTATGDRINYIDGNISFTGGVAGDAALFNGSSGIRLPDGLILGDAYSVSLWLNPEQLTTYTTAFFGARDSNHWVSLVPKGHIGVQNHTMVWSAGSTWYDAAAGMQIGTDEWTHLAFTVGNGTIKVYVDGQETFTGAGFPNTFTTADSLFSLGVNWWDPPFKGLMDELRIYQGTLSEQEISEISGGIR
ncbi:LamG domain-containing protein [Alkalihalobacillus sp. EGI L200015]|nr:LamG domain-containing protein [Pseudalkalibacillus salsuginis]